MEYCASMPTGPKVTRILHSTKISRKLSEIIALEAEIQTDPGNAFLLFT